MNEWSETCSEWTTSAEFTVGLPERLRLRRYGVPMTELMKRGIDPRREPQRVALLACSWVRSEGHEGGSVVLRLVKLCTHNAWCVVIYNPGFEILPEHSEMPIFWCGEEKAKVLTPAPYDVEEKRRKNRGNVEIPAKEWGPSALSELWKQYAKLWMYRPGGTGTAGAKEPHTNGIDIGVDCPDKAMITVVTCPYCGRMKYPGRPGNEKCPECCGDGRVSTAKKVRESFQSIPIERTGYRCCVCGEAATHRVPSTHAPYCFECDRRRCGA